ncbi:hypothetical protein SAMN05421823_109167 [Catalinimonas alkaloidigena]|uniref:Right handed beta helix region n=1 Tax=Catalinimonas alkaloidigena TaxID=1075417 RepID=A0A1G9PE57_9BACT|nr:hypothetical protein [Catalinimonas alkaloidigena]SDL97058.1 hypothetical protein SAMN05421823_109167 [Catalinimonas alkaloidigena]
MKNVILLLSALMLTCPASATILTLDNSENSAAQYASFGAAQNAASAGDTLLVHPSVYSYGDVNLTKRLVLIGPGHDATQLNGMEARFGIIKLQTNSSGSVIESLLCSAVQGDVFQQTDDITIRNCYLESGAPVKSSFGDGSSADRWLVEGNVMTATNCGGCALLNLETSSDDWIVRNNFIQLGSNFNGMLLLKANATFIFSNNVVLVRQTNFPVFRQVAGAHFQNNIFWMLTDVTDFTEECTNCSFVHNLFYSPTATLDAIPGTNNVMNQEPLFTQLTAEQPQFVHTNDYRLAEGSPGKAGGTDASDLGLYGGNYPFRMAGFSPTVPRVSSLTPAFQSVPQGGTVNLQLSGFRAGQ